MTTAITKLPRLWVGYILAVVFLIAEIAVMLKGNLEFLLTTVGLVSWVYWLYCVYKFHDVMERIPGYRHPIASNRAVAMHFIPFYNFYWTFKWPKEIATFVNWRIQARSMNGAVVGVLVLLAVIIMRAVDGFLGLLLLFRAGVYISRRIGRALSAPPVPASAMEPPGVRGPLGL